MNKLLTLLTELESNIANANTSNPTISNGSIGWHIEHTMLVINKVVGTLEKSNPAAYSSKFNFWKTVIFITKKIPRGKVQAPKHVQPANNITTDLLVQHLQLSRASINKLSVLQPNNYFDHPMFGKLNVRETLPFLAIHTQHHLRIINDIVKGSK